MDPRLSCPVSPIPRGFDLDRYRAIAALDSTSPESFARLNTVTNPDLLVPEAFASFGEQPETAVLINRGGNILVVAHVDCVQPPSATARLLDLDGTPRLYSPVLDNRLGVYLALDVLPAYDVVADVLLTTNEERGASTAALVTTRKQYSWIVSFDRGSEDVVCYHYAHEALHQRLISSGFRIGQGSYSCIVETGHLEAQAFNVGCGVFEPHSPHAYVDLSMLARQLERFAGFYQRWHRTHFPLVAARRDFSRSPQSAALVSFEWLLHQLSFALRNCDEQTTENVRVLCANSLAAHPSLWVEFAGELERLGQFDPSLRPR